MENTVEKLYKLRGNIEEIYNQIILLQDKCDHIEGGYYLQLIEENLYLCLGRFDYELNITINRNVFDSGDKEPDKPYDIYISDIYTDLDILVGDNWDIISNDKPLQIAREYLINALLWTKKELNRLIKRQISL